MIACIMGDANSMQNPIGNYSGATLPHDWLLRIAFESAFSPGVSRQELSGLSSVSFMGYGDPMTVLQGSERASLPANVLTESASPVPGTRVRAQQRVAKVLH